MNSVTEDKQGAADASPAQPESGSDPIDLLRRFHYGEPTAAAATSPPNGTILPALLNPYRESAAIRYQYPLYLAPADSPANADLAKPLTEFLAESVHAFAPGDDEARILKDNLPWVERYLRRKMAGADPVDAPALLTEATRALQDHLGLSADSRESLQADLDRLEETVAEGARFLAYGPDVSLHLLVHAIRHRDEPRREAFRQQVERSINGLRALLRIEKSKTVEGNKPDSIESSVGREARHLDASVLSDMLEKRAHGSVEMPAARRARVEGALARLEAWQYDPVLVRFVGRVDNPWFGKQAWIEVIASDEPCSRATEVFGADAGQFARLFAALRVAQLEIDDRYDPAIHDTWFESFDWQSFSDEELQHVTRVVALVSADHLACDGLPSFSRLLGSRLPVHVLSWVRAYDNPAVKPGEGPFDAYRFELAYFGVGHRQVVVAQASAARHEDLLAGFDCALGCNRTSLHLINRGTQTRTKKPLLDPWFVASAALESRAHPFLLVNPDAGDHAAERIRFDGNPQAGRDWPIEKLEYQGQDGEVSEMELAFTFADYALLMPAVHEHFRMVPVGYESDDLVPVDEYLDRDPDQVDRLVPSVWGIDAQGDLVRLVVSRALVFACQDRRNYWRTLQELAGIHNFYVDEAIKRVVEEQRAATASEVEKLQKEHEQELETARSEAAGDAMGQLVDVLMGADLSGMLAGGVQLATMPSPKAAPGAAPVETEAETAVEVASEPEPEPEEEEEVSFDEPWLDTASCTTCDDCMGVNKMMFAYNADKQAYLKDPKAGPYADLVEAAEICPAQCIHPGKPLDPNEPGLEELIARAAPFN